MGGDETEEEPVEKTRRAVVDRAEPVRVERPTAGDRAELREERASRRDEQRDRVAQRDARGGDPSGQGVRGRERLDLGDLASVLVGRVEVGEQRGDQSAAVIAKRLALGGWERLADRAGG